MKENLGDIAKTDLLILDDFGLKPLTPAERLDLLELIDDRHGRHSTLLTSQLPIALGILTWAMIQLWLMPCWIAS